MIGEAELRRCAARWGVDPMVADLDYSLGWFIVALYSANEVAGRLCFKGGTCLRKCYFADYRFSEDLDFTATVRLSPDRLLEWVEQATRWAAEMDGPDYRASPPRLETVQDEYGSETYQVRVYYRGPLRWGGNPRAIRLDVTREERLGLPPVTRRLIHPYSDGPVLAQAEIACYTLIEVLAEKVRAVGGQRRFAISRDIYDIHGLVQSGVTVADIVPLLPAKFKVRGLDIESLNVEHVIARRAAFEDDWNRRLSHLIHGVGAVIFDVAWETTVDVLRQVEEGLMKQPPASHVPHTEGDASNART
ncbi:MAG TPA: nucleotidyl transferase AbiEii/AbiGii toxin family protein [Chloroflexi bacterium]|nr:nucleotidyl transferase AbiEii/AbiGii toxin family protein [Chloroflexota bacterium]